MFYKICFLLICVALYSPSASLASEIPYAHTKYADIDGKPYCIDCHDDDGDIVFSRYNHTLYFADNHRLVGRQNSKICYMCHSQRSCNDCHAVGSELKPSQRNQNDINKRTPHRGDYLNKHKIDGHVSPISCYRCHGNPRTAKTCVRCHGHQ